MHHKKLKRRQPISYRSGSRDFCFTIVGVASGGTYEVASLSLKILMVYYYRGVCVMGYRSYYITVYSCFR